jgi:flagellar protein FlbT
MPLTIPLPAGAKVIINGAVIQNSGYANISLTIHNKANILRDKDVLTQDEANTPAKEIYYAIQNAYLFEANRGEWENIAYAFLDRHLAAVPEAVEIIKHIRDLIQESKLYNGLRASRRLIALEAGEPLAVVSHANWSPGDSRVAWSGSRGDDELSRLRGKVAALERRLSAIDPDA